jgi:hypothetical protein
MARTPVGHVGGLVDIQVNYLYLVGHCESACPCAPYNNKVEVNITLEQNHSCGPCQLDCKFGQLSIRRNVQYSLSKTASHLLLQAQRRDLANTLVIGLYPGPLGTEIVDNMVRVMMLLL